MAPRFLPIVALCAAVIITPAKPFPLFSLFRRSQYDEETQIRRLDIAVDTTDEYADASISVIGTQPLKGIGTNDHAKIKSILSNARELMNSAKELYKNESTHVQAKQMLEHANVLFREAKEHIRGHSTRKIREMTLGDDEGSMLRGGDANMEEDIRSKYLEEVKSKYLDHNVRQAKEDEDRAMDISRSVYETLITFPACLERLFEDCLALVNSDLKDLGLSTIEIVVHQKRNMNQDGYNKVVIVTNELADKVKGRSGDGIVHYPFPWDDYVQGQRTLGVDGKWNCKDFSPEDCCDTVKQSVPNQDTRGNDMECHIFVPFGGIGNRRRNDRVFINLSPDGRVHEAPMVT